MVRKTPYVVNVHGVSMVFYVHGVLLTTQIALALHLRLRGMGKASPAGACHLSPKF